MCPSVKRFRTSSLIAEIKLRHRRPAKMNCVTTQIKCMVPDYWTLGHVPHHHTITFFNAQAMSALGQKQTYAVHKGMSALGHKRTSGAIANVGLFRHAQHLLRRVAMASNPQSRFPARN